MQFIYVGIPKNASSTLRAEFLETHYQGIETTYHRIPDEQQRSFFTFVVLRDPVTRLLSAYQEVNLRYGDTPEVFPEFDFWSLPDDMSRFDAFLDEVARSKFDPHLEDQTDLLRDVQRIDHYLQQERLQDGFQMIRERIGFRGSDLPFRRSRDSRIEQYSYRSFYLVPDELSAEQLRRVGELYSDDVALYDKVFRNSVS